MRKDPFNTAGHSYGPCLFQKRQQHIMRIMYITEYVYYLLCTRPPVDCCALPMTSLLHTPVPPSSAGPASDEVMARSAICPRILIHIPSSIF